MPNNIRKLRNQMKWTQEQLGNKLGVHSNTVKNWELGATDPKSPQIIAMAELFGCNAEQVMGLEPVPDAPAA